MTYHPVLLEAWAKEYAMEERWEKFEPIRAYSRGFSDSYDVQVNPGFVGQPIPNGDGAIYGARYGFENGVLKPKEESAAWCSSGLPDSFLITRPIMRRLGLVPACWLFVPPGMGKTSFATKCHYVTPIYDVDYGNWRRSEGLPSKWDMNQDQYRETLRRFMDYVRDQVPCARPRYPFIPLFLCNELDIIPFALAMGHEVGMVLPAREFKWTWIDGIIRRAEDRASWAPHEPDAGADELAFAKKARQRHSCWIEDWKAAAVGWSLPVQDLDHYLSESDVGILRQGCQLSPALRELAAVGAPKKR